jgi:hypothetical protein
LGVSISTIDRRIVPEIETFFDEWGMRRIPIDELKRYVSSHRRSGRKDLSPRRSRGRQPAVPPHGANESGASPGVQLRRDRPPARS